jgi:hypothetical protein
MKSLGADAAVRAYSLEMLRCTVEVNLGAWCRVHVNEAHGCLALLSSVLLSSANLPVTVLCIE